ncbi:MAG: hypothetical protein U0L62_01290 [Paludibacteraceae bacterium]|nr:hypothetical protein [Paludibacteraceae bacterium]
MATSNLNQAQGASNFEVINQMYAATIAANENKAIIDALRPEAEKAVQELLKQQGKPASFSGTIEYNGIKIVVRRPTSYTWEKNNSVQDDNIAYYKKLHACYEQLQTDVKELRADLKRTAEKLAKAHPNSDSIKHGFVIAFAFSN